MRAQSIVVSILGALAMSGCSGGGTGGTTPVGVVTAPPIVKTFTFPQGDAKMPTSGTAFDIIQIKTTLSSQYFNANRDAYDFLTIETTFAQDISAAFPKTPTQSTLLTPSQLGETVFFDTGSNPIFPDCASSTIRDSYVSSANMDANGNYPIDGSNAVLVNTVKAATLTQSIPLGGLNIHAGPSLPKLGLTIAVFNGGQEGDFSTDCASIDGALTNVGV